jgi:hypothetical protein
MILDENGIVIHKSVYKPTNDDWYPAFIVGNRDLNLVQVTYTRIGPDDGKYKWRVCVYGADDCGMERDYWDPRQALNMFYYVSSLEYVDRKDLIECKFISA